MSENSCYFVCLLSFALADTTFETGAYEVPSKSQNIIVLDRSWGIAFHCNGHTLASFAVVAK